MNTNVKLNMINQVYFKYFQKVLNESSVTMMPKLKPEQENITNSSNLNTNFNTTSNLKVRIPKDIPRHFGGGGLNLNEDSDNSSKFFLNSKRKRLMKKVTQCPHKDARHYAKVTTIFNLSEHVQQLLPQPRPRQKSVEVHSQRPHPLRSGRLSELLPGQLHKGQEKFR